MTSRESRERSTLGATSIRLIDLLVVGLILVVLVAVVTFAMSRSGSATRSCKAEQRRVMAAIDAYEADRAEEPGSNGDLTGGADPYLEDDPTWWVVGDGGVVARTSEPAADCP